MRRRCHNLLPKNRLLAGQYGLDTIVHCPRVRQMTARVILIVFNDFVGILIAPKVQRDWGGTEVFLLACLACHWCKNPSTAVGRGRTSVEIFVHAKRLSLAHRSRVSCRQFRWLRRAALARGVFSGHAVFSFSRKNAAPAAGSCWLLNGTCVFYRSRVQ